MAQTVFCLFTAAVVLAGCKHSSPSVTAVPLSPWNRDEPEGIPFYLPKPLLIVAKNFRYIEEPKVGLTTSAPIPNYFDDQSKYADLNARTNFVDPPPAPGAPGRAALAGTEHVAFGAKDAAAVSEPVLHSGGAPVSPGVAPSDGLAPETFYTYQIIFVPDLTQKYGLRVKGGVGEIRAALNLVNGWQFTGLGPYYMKDSSTAQNTLASGIAANLAASGVADVITGIAGLSEQLAGRGVLPADRTLTETEVREILQPLHGLAPVQRIDGFAEIHIYEPQMNLLDGTMCWVPVTELSFYRDFIAAKTRDTCVRHAVPAPPAADSRGPLDPETARGIAEAAATGVAAGLSTRGTRADGLPAAGQINVNQNCAPAACPVPVAPRPKHDHVWSPLGWLGHHKAPRSKIQTVVREQPLGPGFPAAAFDTGGLLDIPEFGSGDVESDPDPGL